MSHVYAQRTGRWTMPNGRSFDGYSGHPPDGRNNPDLERLHAVGPLPRGVYEIVGPPVDTPEHGPYVLHLLPAPETPEYGRSGFLVHGDAIAAPGYASQGCIVLPRLAREAIWNSGDRWLTVVADAEPAPLIAVGDLAA